MEGTDSTAGLALAPHELLRAFNAQTLARGETYANQGRVVAARYDPVDGTLTGSCLGSKSEYYDVEVALSGPRTGLEIEYTVCTCPVGRYCKHAVALLMAAIPSAPDRAARVVTNTRTSVRAFKGAKSKRRAGMAAQATGRPGWPGHCTGLAGHTLRPVRPAGTRYRRRATRARSGARSA